MFWTILGVILAFVAVIPVFIFIKERYLQKPHSIDLDYKNCTIMPVRSNTNQAIDGKIFFVISGLKIINNGDKNITIKSVKLNYHIDETEYFSESIMLMYGKLKDGTSAAIMANIYTGVKIVVMGWINLIEIIGHGKLLQPGEVINSFAAFPLDGFKDIESINEIQMIIEDYKGKKSIHKLEKNEELIKAYDSRFAFISRKFEQNVKDEFIWK